MSTPHRLRKHADYQYAYARSRRQSTRQLAYFYAPRPLTRRSETAGPRVGLTVPKALGKAHDRNRIKRRLRAVVRANIALLTSPVDLILHPRRSVLTAEFADLTREIIQIFRSVQSALNRLPATAWLPTDAPSPAHRPRPNRQPSIPPSRAAASAGRP